MAVVLIVGTVVTGASVAMAAFAAAEDRIRRRSHCDGESDNEQGDRKMRARCSP